MPTIPLSFVLVIRWPLAVYLAMSALTFILYLIDKRRAARSRWRISETTLHLCELLGGWPGALLAQHTLRHKNRKTGYQVIFWLIVLLHVLGWLWWMGWLRVG